MRLIDADKLIKEIEPMYIAKKDDAVDTFAGGYVQFEELIKQQPTIDIVRCEDCKYCKIEDWDGDNYRVCKRDQHVRSGSWFCADGEREERDYER